MKDTTRYIKLVECTMLLSAAMFLVFYMAGFYFKSTTLLLVASIINILGFISATILASVLCNEFIKLCKSYKELIEQLKSSDI